MRLVGDRGRRVWSRGQLRQLPVLRSLGGGGEIASFGRFVVQLSPWRPAVNWADFVYLGAISRRVADGTAAAVRNCGSSRSTQGATPLWCACLHTVG